MGRDGGLLVAYVVDGRGVRYGAGNAASFGCKQCVKVVYKCVSEKILLFEPYLFLPICLFLIVITLSAFFRPIPITFYPFYHLKSK